MAILKPINSKANTASALKSLINYIVDPKKTANGLYVFGKDCINGKAYESMMTVKEHFRKTEGRQCLHFTHSFPPSDNVSPELAFDIGREFVMNCEILKDFQVLLSVHTNEDHMHLHYIINSVNQNNGRKWQNSTKDLELMRDFSDSLCLKYNLSVLEKGGLIAACISFDNVKRTNNSKADVCKKMTLSFFYSILLYNHFHCDFL